MLPLVFALFAVIAPGGPPGEVERIQTHLAIVDGELRAADTAALTVDQLERRASLIAELARYRERGVFPRNLDFDVRTPYFIDDRGVRCAMAHLIETHGGAALVARVVGTANNAYVRELAGDAELIAWLEHHGLSVAEAARIQPSYSREVGEECAGGYYACRESTCEPTLDEPRLAYCSPACDPAVGACPVGIENIQMECQARGDRYLCVYPEPSPGSVGWRCTLQNADVCEWTCIGVETATDVGTCAPACSDSRACPAGYECEPLGEGSGHLRTCFPIEKDGCSAARPGPAAYLIGLLAVALLVRRRRR